MKELTGETRATFWRGEDVVALGEGCVLKEELVSNRAISRCLDIRTGSSEVSIEFVHEHYVAFECLCG